MSSFDQVFILISSIFHFFSKFMFLYPTNHNAFQKLLFLVFAADHDVWRHYATRILRNASFSAISKSSIVFIVIQRLIISLWQAHNYLMFIYMPPLWCPVNGTDWSKSIISVKVYVSFTWGTGSVSNCTRGFNTPVYKLMKLWPVNQYFSSF